MAFRPDDQPDAIAALRSYLAGEIAEPVYGLYLSRTPNNPRECVLLSPTSGEDNRNWETMEIDVICYGATMQRAGRLRRKVTRIMRNLQRDVERGCLLHSATLQTGPVAYVDTTDGWPTLVETWRVHSSLEPVT